MRIRDRVTGAYAPGEWGYTDDMSGYPPCPKCGADEGAQCSIPNPDQPGFGSEIGGYVHEARLDVETA